MNKNAYTLSEVLISLGIVALLAAVLVPGLGKLMPDSSKMKIINLDAQISNAVTNLLNQDTLYNCDPEGDLEGLACDDAVEGWTSNYSGDEKFEKLMAEELGLVATNKEGFSWKSSNGTLWSFTKVGEKNDAYYIITIDLNGSKSPNEVFSAEQEKPDQFKFKVGNYGGVLPNDALTEAYLRNSLKLNIGEDDKDVAKKLLESKTYSKSTNMDTSADADPDTGADD